MICSIQALYLISRWSLNQCFNLLALDKQLRTIPSGAGITLAVTESGRIIDHTAMEYLHQFEEECVHAGRPFEIQGLDHFYHFTRHPLSVRMHDAKLVKDKVRLSAREQQMAEIARHHGFQFTPATVGALNSHDFVYLRRGTDRQESNVMTGSYHGCQVKLFDYSHTAAPDYHAEHRHTLILAHVDTPLPNLVITPGHYLERYLVEFQEVELASHPTFAQHYRLYAHDPMRALACVESQLQQLLMDQPGFYVEIRDQVLLAFRPDQDLLSPDAIERLLAFAEAVGGARKPE